MDAQASRASRTLVMIHGAFCGGWAFEPLANYFEHLGYRCLTPTLRHHDGVPGERPHPDLATTSMADYAADIAALLDTLPEPPILIGHSMGGLVAQMVAVRRPVAALVLLAPCAPWGVFPSTALEFLGAQSLFFNGAFWQEALLPIYEVGAQYTFDRLPKTERRAVFDRLVPESGRATFEVLNWPQDLARTTFVFPRDVKCPVLGLSGTEDRVNPVGTVRRITRRYRNGNDFIALEGLSHWLLSEPGWEDMADHIANWLKQTLVSAETAD